MDTGCVSADAAEAAYNRLCRSHPAGMSDDDCQACAPFAAEIDRLAAECEIRGCVEGRCVYDVGAGGAGLSPTPELIAAARQIRDERVEAAHDEPPAKDLHIAALLDALYVQLIFTPAFQITPDYWRLTDAGREWLDRHDGRVE